MFRYKTADLLCSILLLSDGNPGVSETGLNEDPFIQISQHSLLKSRSICLEMMTLFKRGGGGLPLVMKSAVSVC